MREFRAESKKLLELMISSIYTNHEVFLRELISNASDALDKLRLSHADSACTDDTSADAAIVTSQLGIHLAYDSEARTLTISDTGIGMDKEALEECLGTIAHSESLKIKEQLNTTEASADVDLIGQFGVGFYSSFMVADQVTVISRAEGCEQAYKWESNGVEGYSITPAKRDQQGTDVILHLRESTADENLERYLDQSSLQNLIKKYSNYIRYPITMDLAEESYEEESGALVRDESSITRQVVNAMTPLWSFDESEVSAESLNEFYRFEFHGEEDPLRVIRARARGAIEYDALLFIPNTAPAKLYSSDYHYGLKLYSSGVLIDETFAGLIPSHFRFIQGIVDTTNISLNISREMIQEDSRIQIIGRQLERSIMDHLQDMAQNDRSAYEAFYRAFGTGLKFSVCQSQGTLTDVLSPLLLYYSAKEQRLITLQDYLDATENTKHTQIHYAVGSDVSRLAKSPTVHAVLDLGHDVLLCPNGAQDELCFKLMGSYKGARFHSVTSAALESDQSSEADQVQPIADETRAPVLQALHSHAPEPLVRVVASHYLTKSAQAAARVATEGVMTISMAKYIETKLDKDELGKPLYILEVNTSHALFKLASEAFCTQDTEALANLAKVLLGQALLAEDIPLSDPVAFNEAVNALLPKALALKKERAA